MSTKSTYSRIARRETHSPRSVPAIVIAIVLILAAAYAIVELVLTLAGRPALLVTPGDAARGLVSVATLPFWVLLVSGIVLAIVGIVLIVVASSPGRRPRHLIRTDRAVTVVDDRALASALARHASYAGNTDPDTTRVTVSHSRAVVDITPASGRSVDREAVKRAVDDQLAGYDVRPSLTSKITVRTTGKVGA